MKHFSVLFLSLLILFTGYGFAQKTIKLPELTDPVTISIDKDHLYITEDCNIYIYSKNNLKLIKKFGKAGGLG